ncbi:Arginine N-succinyltransferase [compost metagenome]
MCLVANEKYNNFRAMLIKANPKGDRLIIDAKTADALKCSTGDKVRLVRLCPEEKKV